MSNGTADPGGLAAAEWVALGIFVAGACGGFLWWLWLRFLAKIDKLEVDLYGKDGVVADLNTSMAGIRARYGEFVSQEDFDVQLSHLDGHIKELQREGAQREQHILKAIEKMDERAREDQRLLRQDFAAVHARIDNVLAALPGKTRRSPD